MWAVMTEEVVIPVEAIYDANNAHVLTEGLLTLVELSHLARFSLQDATDWVLELMQIYLTSGITHRVATGSRAI